MSEMHLETALSQSSGFSFGEVSSLTALRARGAAPPSLGPLAAFTGAFRGSGFNLIFRPDSAKTPTPLPIPVTGSDNVLELNLTLETLSFAKGLGSVPNRGSNGQYRLVKPLRECLYAADPGGGLWYRSCVSPCRHGRVFV